MLNCQQSLFQSLVPHDLSENILIWELYFILCNFIIFLESPLFFVYCSGIKLHFINVINCSLICQDRCVESKVRNSIWSIFVSFLILFLLLYLNETLMVTPLSLFDYQESSLLERFERGGYHSGQNIHTHLVWCLEPWRCAWYCSMEFSTTLQTLHE